MCILHKREKWKFALGSSVESASRIRQKPARRFRRETFSSPRSGTSRRKTADGNTQMHVPITGSRPRNPRITAHGNDIPLRHATGALQLYWAAIIERGPIRFIRFYFPPSSSRHLRRGTSLMGSWCAFDARDNFFSFWFGQRNDSEREKKEGTRKLINNIIEGREMDGALPQNWIQLDE